MNKQIICWTFVTAADKKATGKLSNQGYIAALLFFLIRHSGFTASHFSVTFLCPYQLPISSLKLCVTSLLKDSAGRVAQR